MKKTFLLICILMSTACANMSFEAQPSLTIAPVQSVEQQTGYSLITEGTTTFVNINNDYGLPTVQVNIAAFTENSNHASLLTGALAYAPVGWIWEITPSTIYGGLGQETIGIQGKNFELRIFTQSGAYNIFSDLYPKDNKPQQWLVCQITRLENFSTEKIILDYREIVTEQNLSVASPDVLAFKAKAVSLLEKMVVLGFPERTRQNPDLATRYLGTFVGQLQPLEEFLRIQL